MNRKQRRARKNTHPPSPAAPARDPIALHSAGVEAFRAGDFERATDLISQAIAANGDMPDLYYNLAIVLRAQGKLLDAAASYQRAILLKPDYADAHNNLGNVWKALGERETARACFERALHCKPDNADTHYNLGILCSDLGDREEAARYFQRCLDEDPRDSRGVALLLARLGLASAPERTPQAQLLRVYGVRSRFWDRESSYFAHALVAEALEKHSSRTALDVLDIGCGTGLVGARIRHLAGRLDGVDISPAMLEKARDKKIYNRLDQADLVPFMCAHTDSYDAILGAATLIHLGSLQTAFQAAAHCLRTGGLFVFTLLSNDEADYAVAANDKLAQSGCYTHSLHYVERLAANCGFVVQSLEHIVHERDQDDNPIPGILAVLQPEERSVS